MKGVWVKSLFLFNLTIPFAWAEKLEPIQEVFEPENVPFSGDAIKVAVVQWAAAGAIPVNVSQKVAQSYKNRNMDELAEYIREAAGRGAALVVTPEFGIVGYPDIPELPDEEDQFRNRAEVKPYTEAIPGPATNYFGKLAQELKIYIHFGMVEVDPKTDKYYNTVVAIGPQGEVLAKFRKNQLFDKEVNFVEPGQGPAFYNAPWGKTGFLICADVYDSELLGQYKDLKVDVLALSTSWAQQNTGWGYFTRAARFVRAYLLASNNTYFPDSGVINPDGSKQSHIRQSGGIAYGYLPRKAK